MEFNCSICYVVCCSIAAGVATKAQRHFGLFNVLVLLQFGWNVSAAALNGTASSTTQYSTGKLQVTTLTHIIIILKSE